MKIWGTYESEEAKILRSKMPIDTKEYCASDCECINCIMNKANISDYNTLHFWIRQEDIEDCPLNQLTRQTNSLA